MSDELLFLEDAHPKSRRIALLEDDGASVWLYLTEADSRKPVADAWVCNRIVAPTTESIQAFHGRPPPAAKGFASDSAQCEDPAVFEWSFIWSVDGQSVAVSKSGKPAAFIVAGHNRGFSRELIREGPWGLPWDDKLFTMAFGDYRNDRR